MCEISVIYLNSVTANQTPVKSYVPLVYFTGPRLALSTQLPVFNIHRRDFDRGYLVEIGLVRLTDSVNCMHNVLETPSDIKLFAPSKTIERRPASRLVTGPACGYPYYTAVDHSFAKKQVP
ncbi:hypothetical protein T265_10264 [Opisthorchis viverrini]|uniref:Uncharacterized protein n=1 Tax=Opisthorchis viverrini TaxID=6198 RepID=A0A074Z2U5_OPIVI|nr:hypothetical protein T265_10264 [Opisthorchis viverrini]KER21391.1 hypothetical protein T265_10264 [Opisthorchis viverrini]